MGKYDALQICEYLTGAVQNFGIGRLRRPSLFCEEESTWNAIVEEGRKVLMRGFELLASKIAGKTFLFERFSIADASIFYFEYQAADLKLPMPPQVQAHYEMMRARPSVQRALAREGLG